MEESILEQTQKGTHKENYIENPIARYKKIKKMEARVQEGNFDEYRGLLSLK